MAGLERDEALVVEASSAARPRLPVTDDDIPNLAGKSIPFRTRAGHVIAECGIRIADYKDGETGRRGDEETFDDAASASLSPRPLSIPQSEFRIPQSVCPLAAGGSDLTPRRSGHTQRKTP